MFFYRTNTDKTVIVSIDGITCNYYADCLSGDFPRTFRAKKQKPRLEQSRTSRHRVDEAHSGSRDARHVNLGCLRLTSEWQTFVSVQHGGKGEGSWGNRFFVCVCRGRWWGRGAREDNNIIVCPELSVVRDEFFFLEKRVCKTCKSPQWTFRGELSWKACAVS